MKSSHIASTALGAMIALGSFGAATAPAVADTASTAAIAIGAAAIIGALLTDNSGRSYYVRGNQRHYVSHDTAVYYRSHRGGYGNNRGGQMHGNMGQGNMGHGNMGHDDHNDRH
jgi:hypothetical protein